jgi:hypothetical membrane protein
MSKLFITVGLLLTILTAAFGQDSLRTIKSTSDKISLRIGDELFLKDGWILEPSKNPDVYVINSKWLYKTKDVTFITDIDSLTFKVKAGNNYNFIILLNEKEKCYIKIITLPNPLIWNIKIIVAIIIVFIIGLLFIYRGKTRIIRLIYFGYIAPIFFWLLTFFSGAIHGNYNHLKNVISELGAIGTKSEIITSVSAIFLSFFCVLYSIGVYKFSRAMKLSLIPAILTFIMPITFLWIAIFPLGNELHNSTGPLPLGMILACLLSCFLWKRGKEFSNLKVLSFVSFLIMMLLLTRFIKPFGQQYEGLTQRFFYFGWSVWTFSTTYYFSKKQNQLTK